MNDLMLVLCSDDEALSSAHFMAVADSTDCYARSDVVGEVYLCWQVSQSVIVS